VIKKQKIIFVLRFKIISKRKSFFDKGVCLQMLCIENKDGSTKLLVEIGKKSKKKKNYKTFS